MSSVLLQSTKQSRRVSSCGTFRTSQMALPGGGGGRRGTGLGSCSPLDINTSSESAARGGWCRSIATFRNLTSRVSDRWREVPGTPGWDAGASRAGRRRWRSRCLGHPEQLS